MTMKTISARIKEIKSGGFFTNGYIVYEIVANDDGKEFHIDDIIMTPSNIERMKAHARKIRDEFIEKGYEAYGDWS